MNNKKRSLTKNTKWKKKETKYFYNCFFLPINEKLFPNRQSYKYNIISLFNFITCCIYKF